MILSARRTRLTTPAFVVFPVVIIETIVASEPVPAVVGTCMSGIRSPEILSTPYISESGWQPLIKTDNNLATSIELPPPKPITPSHLND